MNLKFDLQFFGGTKQNVQRIAKRDPEPEALTNLRNNLSDIFGNSLKNFDANQWGKAQDLNNQVLGQQSSLISQLTGKNGMLTRNKNIANDLYDVAKNGTLPQNLTNNMNASVNKELQSSMGDMINSLANRGVLNSSVTTAGTNQLSQAAADAFNKNYLSAYQSTLSGLGSALQGSQNNTASMLSALGAIGQVPSQTMENIGAQINPAYNFWKDWQNFYQSDDPYDTIVTTKQSSCITGDTLLTLEDGREIPAAELKNSDRIKVWDFNEGKISSAPLTGFFKGNEDEGFDVIRIAFEDSSNVGVIVEHSFFDLTLGKFVAVNAESQNFVGHEFAKVTPEGKIIPVKVTEIYSDGKVNESYGPQAEGSWNYLAGGFISGNDGQLAMCNMFDFDTEAMTYDKDKKAADLEKYGLLNYDVFDGIITRKIFNSNHFDECSVAFGKGLADLEAFRAYIAKFKDFFFHNSAGGVEICR